MPVVGTVTEVLAVTANIKIIKKLSNPQQKCFIKRCRSSQVERQAMTHNRHSFRKGPELLSATPAYIDPILRCHLQEIDLRGHLLLQHVHMDPPKAETCAVNGELRS